MLAHDGFLERGPSARTSSGLRAPLALLRMGVGANINCKIYNLCPMSWQSGKLTHPANAYIH